MKWKWSSDATLASNKGEVFLRHGSWFHCEVEVRFFHQAGFFATHNSSILELENCLKRLCCRRKLAKEISMVKPKGSSPTNN